jgi:hypothetical protein
MEVCASKFGESSAVCTPRHARQIFARLCFNILVSYVSFVNWRYVSFVIRHVHRFSLTTLCAELYSLQKPATAPLVFLFMNFGFGPRDLM